MSAVSELPEYDEDEAVVRWSAVLFQPPRANMERALGVPDPPDRAPKGLTLGAWRAWREAQAIELAREHWENLVTRGLVPPECLEDQRRTFVGTRPTHRPDRGKTSTTYVRAVFSHPPTVDAAIALASDMGSVLAVEELAREWRRRAEAFLPAAYGHEYRTTEAISWSLGPSLSAPSMWALPEPSELAASLIACFTPPTVDTYAALRASSNALRSLTPEMYAWVQHAMLNERLDRLLARAKELDLAWRPPRYDVRRRAPVANYAGVLSPFATTTELLRRGYGFSGIEGSPPRLRLVGLSA